MEYIPSIISAVLCAVAFVVIVISSARRREPLTEPQMRLLLDANNERASKLLSEIEKRDTAIERLSQEVHTNKEAMLELQNSLLSARLEIEILKGLIYQHLGEEKARHALAGLERTKRAVNTGQTTAKTGKAAAINLVEEGHLERAIEVAIGICHGCEAANDLTAISGRYSELQRSIMAGDIAHPDALKEKNTIRMALLAVLSEMEG